MALIGSIVISLSAQTDKLTGGLNRGAKSVRQFTGQLGNLKTVVAGALGVFAVDKAVHGLGDLIHSGADLNETLSKTQAILGAASPEVEKFAQGLADQFGVIKKDTLDVASSIGGLGKGLGGLSGKGLSDFTIQFTQLAADLGSFANMDMKQAGEALLVGLSGEQSDTLKKLGVTLLDTKVSAEAFALGYRKVNGSFTDQAKVAARASLIMKGLKDAQGDLARTAGSAANQERKLTGGIENAKADLATTFQPITEAILRLANEGFSALTSQLTANRTSWRAWAEDAAQGNSEVASTMAGVAAGIGTVADIGHTLGLGFQFAKQKIVSAFAYVAEGLNSASQALADFFSKLTGVKTEGVSDSQKAFAEGLRAEADKMHAEFQKALIVEPPSTKIKATFDEMIEKAKGVGKAVTDGIKKPLSELPKSINAATEGVEELGKKFKLEQSTFGMSGRMKEIEELKQKGATEEQLAPLRKQAARLDLMDQAKDLAGDMGSGPRLAGAAAYGSGEAASIINNYKAGAQAKNPLEALSKEQSGYLRTLVEIARKNQTQQTQQTFALATF